MIELTFLDDNCCETSVFVIEVEKSDIDPRFDTHIRTVETYLGWWELYNIGGQVCGYFEQDEELITA